MSPRRPPLSAVAASAQSLPVALPFAGDTLFSYLAGRAVAGVEEATRAEDGSWRYCRSLRLDCGDCVAAVVWQPGADHLECTFALGDDADAAQAMRSMRYLFDLDANPERIDAAFRADRVLGPLVARRPGLRSPGHPDGAELVVRAIVGQQVSVAGARTVLSRLAAQHGAPLAHPAGGITHLFPSAAAFASLDPGDLPMPAARGRALIECCRLLATGELVLRHGVDIAAAAAQLQAVPGIGPWTAGYVAMRALGDPDVFLPTDVGVRNALQAAGIDGSPRAAAALAEQWRPWRSYALHHLWAQL